jgi:uncharacterized Zn finger protein
MKPEKAKPEHEIKKIMEEKDQNFFYTCPNCGHIYEDLKHNALPLRCVRCNYCLICGS